MTLTKLAGTELDGGSWVVADAPGLSGLLKLSGTELDGGSWVVADLRRPKGFRNLGLTRGARSVT